VGDLDAAAAGDPPLDNRARLGQWVWADQADWCAAADSGAQLLWRVKADMTLPVLELLPDGSYRSVLISPKITGKARHKLIEAARAGGGARRGPGPPRPGDIARVMADITRKSTSTPGAGTGAIRGLSSAPATTPTG
jgi:hypothetical protein